MIKLTLNLFLPGKGVPKTVTFASEEGKNAGKGKIEEGRILSGEVKRGGEREATRNYLEYFNL